MVAKAGCAEVFKKKKNIIYFLLVSKPIEINKLS